MEKKIVVLLPFILVLVLLGACSSEIDPELLEFYLSRTQTALAAEEQAAIPTDTPIPDDSITILGGIQIPDVIGMTREDAYDILEELGLVPKTFWVMDNDFIYGDVTDIEPGVGEIVQADTEIILDVVGEVVNNDPGDDGDDDGSSDGPTELIQIQILNLCGNKPSQINCPTEFRNWCECTGGTVYCDGSGIASFIP